MNLNDMNKEEIINYINNANSGFIRYNNIKLVDYDSESATMEVILNENSLNPYGMAHGGLIFTIADTAMGVIARATGKLAVTLNSQINYLKAGKSNKLMAKATAIKIGRNTAVLKADIYDNDNNLISNATATYYFLEEKK